MVLFDYFRRKKVDGILEYVKKKNIGKRYLMLILGCLIVAFAFNLFFLKYNIVCFGVSGVFLAEPISNVIGGIACYITMRLTIYRQLDREL